MIDETTIRNAAVFSARLQGCNCDVTIVINDIAPNVFHTTAQHDDHCPLLRKFARHNN